MKVLKQRICRAFACAALALAALPAGAGGYGDPGGVIVDNGAPDHQNGNNMGFAWQADDFTLGTATSLSDFTFWSLEAAGAYRGSISWQILADNGGVPSSLILASGATNSVARSLVGSYLGLDEYTNGVGLGSLSLAAGTYWLVLHNGSPGNLGDPNEFYWETAGANATVGGMESFDAGMTWTGNFSEHAFQISAVPEPEMALMLSGGLLLLGVAYRRGRKGG